MDNFGNRMKEYERGETGRRFLSLLPVYARIDGKCFSNLTKNMNRPYDENMMTCMYETASYLVEQTDALIGYTQSDEISLAWYSDNYDSQIFFDGKIQKMVSVLAAMASVKFNSLAREIWPDLINKMNPVFDCRVFQLPNKVELANAFLWRELDATKNAISMAARSMYSHNQLMNKNGSEMQELMWQKGVNFNDYPPAFKRGSFMRKELVEVCLEDSDYFSIPEAHRPVSRFVKRSRVLGIDMPPFSKVTNRVGVIFNKEEPKTEQD